MEVRRGRDAESDGANPIWWSAGETLSDNCVNLIKIMEVRRDRGTKARGLNFPCTREGAVLTLVAEI